MRRRSYDCAVLGGGPAGSVTAAQFARAGARVLLIERSELDAFKAGEFLPPAAKAFVNAQSLLPTGWEAAHLSVHGFLNGWAGTDLVETNFIVNPYGAGVALDRGLFERQLVHAAELCGVDIRLNCTLGALDRAGSVWSLTFTQSGRAVSCSAAQIVLATGRNARPPAGIFRERRKFDRLVFLAARWQGFDEDLLPSLESAEDGWIYVTAVPHGRTIFYVFFDASAGNTHHKRSIDWLETTIAGCNHAGVILRRVVKAGAVGPRWSAGPAHSSMTRPIFGPGWCAVGDAAQSYDPLSSLGMFEAIRSGVTMAQHLQQNGHRAVAGARMIENERTRSFSHYLSRRRQHYAAETRWPTSKFWVQNATTLPQIDLS